MRPTSPRATATALMRHVVAIVAATAILGLVAFTPASATTTPAPVWVATADGPVTPPLAAYLEKVIRDAQADGAGLVVIEMDSPGGLDTSMRRIIQAEIASTRRRT
jgi:membrane-bound serine protease (ClpP class)